MNLQDLQNQLFLTIRNQSTEDCLFVVNDKKIGREKRLKAYSYSSYRKIEDCIEDDYQVSFHFIPEDLRSNLIKSYLKDYPADTHYINECGRYFLDYLIKSSYKPSYDFLFDLIKLEWLRVESFYDFYDYTKENHTNNQIIINPSLKMLKSKWPLADIWNSKNHAPPKDSHIFIWTTEDRIVDCASWDAKNTEILLELIKVESLDLAVENLLSHFDADLLSRHLQSNLSQWINQGILRINNN